ncbi:tetratricopeptide repeat protein [Salinisphaera sp. USBA-960]|nr:tetratricopeptide repeat protein [Salifodinibacter halophilus]NNC25488.1 tetratricopeptide repeat protein [Salifodinibacter halophilus]
MLAAGHDGPLLRFSLGDLLFKADETAEAARHLGAAVAHDPEYSAAWKLYGQSLAADDRPREAFEAFNTGIEVAERRGDHQAAKEMRVFAKRAQKHLDTPDNE